MKTIFEPHPVSTQRKKELREQGYRIIDAAFAPKEPKTERGISSDLKGMGAEQLHAIAKERGVKVVHNAGAEKVREALREAGA